ncbi:MAG: FAD binding domain-containing protein [Magnetovibrio sp.]|nr:FAD binding domain-containing protein [Magnetovibrio sp.]
MAYLLASSVQEALSCLSQSRHTILAGGTDLYPAAGERTIKGPVLDVSRLEELKGVSLEDGEFRIGGLTTWSEIVAADLPPQFAALKMAAREVGSVQIQNVATIAGNLCNASPAADGVPPLLALNAEVELMSQGGVRRLALADFIYGNRRTALAPDELVSAIYIADDLKSCVSHFAKLGARRYLVISTIMVAVVVELDADGLIAQARICVGACSEVAQRLSTLEQALVGADLNEVASRLQPEHFENLSPITDVRATAQYRQATAIEMVRRALNACGEKLQ